MAWAIAEDELDRDVSEDYDDEAVRSLFEDDDEAWVRRDDEALSEATYPRYRRGRSLRRPLNRRADGLRGGTVRTRAGDAQIQFQKPVATKESVDALAKELREAIKKIDQTLDKNTSMLDKKINAIETAAKKGQQQSSQGMLFPLLLNKPPQIEKLKLPSQVAAGTTLPGNLKAGDEIPIDTTTYKKDDNLLLLLALMMSGGMGGSGDSSSNMMPMMLALALK